MSPTTRQTARCSNIDRAMAPPPLELERLTGQGPRSGTIRIAKRQAIAHNMLIDYCELFQTELAAVNERLRLEQRKVRELEEKLYGSWAVASPRTLIIEDAAPVLQPTHEENWG